MTIRPLVELETVNIPALLCSWITFPCGMAHAYCSLMLSLYDRTTDCLFFTVMTAGRFRDTCFLGTSADNNLAAFVEVMSSAHTAIPIDEITYQCHGFMIFDCFFNGFYDFYQYSTLQHNVENWELKSPVPWTANFLSIWFSEEKKNYILHAPDNFALFCFCFPFTGKNKTDHVSGDISSFPFHWSWQHVSSLDHFAFSIRVRSSIFGHILLLFDYYIQFQLYCFMLYYIVFSCISIFY